ncbi:NEDD8-activating enzyme E1 regulatory subunit AXR1-like protein, partial [Tanacetum coccineum]
TKEEGNNKSIKVDEEGDAFFKEEAIKAEYVEQEHCHADKKLYQAKAEADFLLVEQRVRDILKKIGRDPYSISKSIIKSFCKEFNSPFLPEMQKYLTDEEYIVAMGFYILLRAVDRFAANYTTFPGHAMDEEISRLKTTAVGLLSDLGCNGSTLIKDLINEMCRYGAAELHAVATYVGEVASHEIIKVSTKGVYSTVLVSEHSTGYVGMEYLKAKVMDKDLRG